MKNLHDAMTQLEQAVKELGEVIGGARLPPNPEWDYKMRHAAGDTRPLDDRAAAPAEPPFIRTGAVKDGQMLPGAFARPDAWPATELVVQGKLPWQDSQFSMWRFTMLDNQKKPDGSLEMTIDITDALKTMTNEWLEENANVVIKKRYLEARKLAMAQHAMLVQIDNEFKASRNPNNGFGFHVRMKDLLEMGDRLP